MTGQKKQVPDTADSTAPELCMNRFLNDTNNIPEQYRDPEICPQAAIYSPSKTVLVGETWTEGDTEHHLTRGST